jgi:two-component sensor histidine kinase/CheY-like chemotaxis protein
MIQILLIEDERSASRLIEIYLSEFSEQTKTIVTRSCAEAEKMLNGEKFDVILLDLSLPDSIGIDTFSRVSRLAAKIPIIVLSGTEDRELALQAVRSGAQDYLVKSHFDSYLLERAISYAIERKRSEEQIKRSLQEKEALIREIHHRVKNNLQVICSLLSLQARLGNSDDLKLALAEMRARIISMSLVHEELYQSESFANLNCAHYAERLVSSLIGNKFPRGTDILRHLSLAPVFLPMDMAVPFGLLLNELVANALTHAFKARNEGEVWIKLAESREGIIELLVEDDGPGLPPGISVERCETLGLLLIRTLVEQIGGKIAYSYHQRCSFKISFPCP